jgi:tetratricopeptide (TPR) repeat protein
VTESNESSSESLNNPEAVSPQEISDSAAGGGWTADGDDLPELQELTPELVEEEAIRGDFMLRGAAILLAVLLGCGQIADSRVLVHVRSGDYMQANGLLPPRTDVFSFANEGQPAANVSWLFDHVVSIVWSLGGPLGLTVFKALIAGLIAWLLSRISVRGLPTWWNSICGVIALAACASDLMPVTDLVSLLGLVILLRMLHSAFDGNTDGLIWKAPLLLVIWANMDPHAWLGVAGLFLFSVGRTFARVPGEIRPGAAPGTLWTATAVSAVALLINPFPVASVLSAVQTYFVEYPGMRAFNPINETTVALFDGRTEYYSLFNVETWAGFEFAYVAAIAAVLLGGVSVVLAKDRREAPWAFLLGGFAGLAVLSIHELSAAALVAAAVAGTVGQRWYQKTFPQEYTIKPSEVLFSRAGRAVTVLCLAVFGFLVVTDRLPTRIPLGSGFTSDLQTTIDAFDGQLRKLPEDARVLHTRVDLGDFLIWNERRSFVDSRVTPFGMPDDDESTNQRFRTLRQDMVDASAAVAEAKVTAIQPPNANESDTTGDGPDLAELQATLHRELKAAGITHAVVGLYPPGKPHYRSLGALSSDSDSWTLMGLESSAAIYDYTNGVAVADKSEPFNPAELSFRDVKPENVQRFEFAREPGFYSQYLYNTRPSVSEDLRIARHYLSLRSTPDSLMMVIRAGNRLVSQVEPNADGFFVLALAYSRLAAWENQVAAQAGGRFASDMRYMQVIMAARQAVTLNPEMTGAWNLLYQTYSRRGRVDQALECLSKALPLLEKSLLVKHDENQLNVVAQFSEARQQMAEAVAQIEQELEKGVSHNLSEDPVERTIQKHSIAEQVATRGHIGAALKLLQENQPGLKEAPQIFARAEMIRGQLLLESGALQEGYNLFMQLNAIAEKESQGVEVAYPWTTMAFLSQIGLGAYPQASQEMAAHISRLRSGSDGRLVMGKILVTLPLVASLETTLRSNATTQWPLSQMVSILNPMTGTLQVQVEPRFIQAMAELEGGNVEAARVSLQGLITECGASAYRPLAATYLSLLRDDLSDFLTKNTMSSWEDWTESDFEALTVENTAVSSEPSGREEAGSEEPTEEPNPVEPTEKADPPVE